MRVGVGEDVLDGGVVYADVGAVDECLLLWTVCAVRDCCSGHTDSCREGTNTLNSIAGYC